MCRTALYDLAKLAFSAAFASNKNPPIKLASAQILGLSNHWVATRAPKARHQTLNRVVRLPTSNERAEWQAEMAE